MDEDLDAALRSPLAAELADRLVAAAEQLQDVLAASRDVVALTTLDGVFVYASPAIEQLLGWTPEEAVGLNGFALVHPGDLAETTSKYTAYRAQDPQGVHTFRIRRRDGSWIWVEASASDPRPGQTTIGLVLRDVTERREWEQLLELAALHDAVTGLANRRVLDDQLAAAVARAERGAVPPSLVFLDLDGFKRLNDQYGHVFGDAVLREVAGRLRTTVRAGDTLARWGGDEFAVLCLEGGDGRPQAERVREALSAPLQVGDREILLGASVGVALWRPGLTAAQLLDDADRAMYDAKAQSRT